MTPRLGQHPLARIDQEHGEVSGRCAGDHVARILFVSRRVGDDKLALGTRKEAVGDVDRDALLALGRQPVDQQREVDPFALRTMALAVAFERGQLIVEDLLRFVEQPADQGRLAVIDAAAGDEAQELLRFLLGKPGANVGANEVSIGVEWPGHQKYPSCFFFSIEALPASRSIARPWRSDVVVSSISATISSTVAASLSTAPDSG